MPGSSTYFVGGVVAYANQAKKALLGVRPETLDKFGAVSEETVLEMARGVRLALKADIGVAVSGIAGVCVMVLHRSPATGEASALYSDLSLGNTLALVSGAVFGGYFVLARKFAPHEAAVVTATLWQFLLLTVILAPFTVFTLVRGISGVGYLHLGVFGVLCTAAPILGVVQRVGRRRAQRKHYD